MDIVLAPAERRRRSRRAWLAAAGASVAGLAAVSPLGCETSPGSRSGTGPAGGSPATPDLVWGGPGDSPGRFDKPRAIAINRADELFIVDMTARIQVFTADGQFLRSWKTPESQNGRPTGLGMGNDDTLLVADTHYFRMLTYRFDGTQIEERTIGGVCGQGPGEFQFVTDAVQDSQGNFYVGEYGEFDRVQKFAPDRSFLCEIGRHGEAPGELLRPQGLAVDAEGLLWIADACNHRIQIFDVRDNRPELVKTWGSLGEEPGRLRYPYGLTFDASGHVIVCEFGNQRLQKFTRDGESLGVWGGPGRAPGQLHQPWSCALDSRGRLHVLDSYNHRVQRVRI